MMGKLADALNEKSKRDDALIVGSEIRAALQEQRDEIRLASVYRDLVFKYIDRMSDNVDSDPLERIVGEFVTEFHKVREPLPCDSDRPSPCEHDWDLIGETEKYATHGPDEVGDPVTIYGWKCQKPECGVIQNTITGEPPAADKQPTCCGDATHGCMGLPGADKHETLAEAGKRVADKYGTSDVDKQTPKGHHPFVTCWCNPTQHDNGSLTHYHRDIEPTAATKQCACKHDDPFKCGEEKYSVKGNPCECVCHGL